MATTRTGSSQATGSCEPHSWAGGRPASRRPPLTIASTLRRHPGWPPLWRPLSRPGSARRPPGGALAGGAELVVGQADASACGRRRRQAEARRGSEAARPGCRSCVTAEAPRRKTTWLLSPQQQRQSADDRLFVHRRERNRRPSADLRLRQQNRRELLVVGSHPENTARTGARTWTTTRSSRIACAEPGPPDQRGVRRSQRTPVQLWSASTNDRNDTRLRFAA